MEMMLIWVTVFGGIGLFGLVTETIPQAIIKWRNRR